MHQHCIPWDQPISGVSQENGAPTWNRPLSVFARRRLYSREKLFPESMLRASIFSPLPIHNASVESSETTWNKLSPIISRPCRSTRWMLCLLNLLGSRIIYELPIGSV